MTKRYFYPTPPALPLPSSIRLENEEVHHLLNVMRGKIGDEVVLFDGSGSEYAAVITAVEKRAATLSVVSKSDANRESTVRLHLGVALPKGDRQQWMCEKLVELGCDELTPLITRHGVAEPAEGALARLRRGVIEASKQCRRNRLMRIGIPKTLEQFLTLGDAQTQRIFLDASGTALAAASTTASNSMLAAVGPEGGWSEAELAAARAGGWRLTSLGPRVLRVETAAIAICSRFCMDA